MIEEGGKTYRVDDVVGSTVEGATFSWWHVDWFSLSGIGLR